MTSIRPSGPASPAALYAAVVAILLTALTCLVVWSMACRVRELAHTVPGQWQAIRKMKSRLTSSGQKTLADAAAHYREQLEVERQIGRLEADEHAAMAKSISEMAGFEKTIGRPIRVIPGPPVEFDPGEGPTYPWLPDWLAFVTSPDYRKRCAVWFSAKKACDTLNNAEEKYGSKLADVREKYRKTREEVEACKHAVSAAIGSMRTVSGDEEMEGDDQKSVSPLEVADLMGFMGKETWPTTAKTAFCFLDISTLFACLAMTFVAWSRLFLACGWLGVTRITR